MNPVEPTQQQIANSIAMGYDYLGDGIFCKGDILGWFTKNGGFYKE